MKIMPGECNGTCRRGGIVRRRANGELPRSQERIRALELYITDPDERLYHWRKVRLSDGHVISALIFRNPEHLTPDEFADDIALRRIDLLPILARPHQPGRVAAIGALSHVGERRTP